MAAFAAAGLSLVNVVVTAQLASRLHLQQWRRDEVRPVVERILVCAREAQKAWTSAAVSRELLRIAPDQATDCQETVKEQWDKSGKFSRPITTEITAAGKFYSAEEYHQKYLAKNPGGYTCHVLRD